MNTQKIMNKGVKMIAHRGLSGLEKENTCSAFVAAGNRESYYGIETDIHVTADGEFVVFHDDDTARVGLDRLELEKTTAQTLKSLQLCDIDGKRGRRDLLIPMLKDYILICKKYEKECILEYKNAFSEEDIARSLQVIKELCYLEHVTFISFCFDNLVILRKMCPKNTIQYLLDSWNDAVLAELQRYSMDLDMCHTAITEEIVNAVHSIGQKVNCWTVNDATDGEKLIALGVDYITSDILEGKNER